MATASRSASGWHPQRAIPFVVGTPPGGGQDRPARGFLDAEREFLGGMLRELGLVTDGTI